MASFASQLANARAHARAANGVEAANRALIEKMFDMWDRGEITTRQIRFRLEAVVRASYRASGEVGRDLAVEASGIPGWRPTNNTWRTEYLDSLQADTRAAVSEYIKARARKSLSPEDIAKARKRAVMRAQHSAGVATTRGYSDGVIGSFAELEAMGYRVEKIWCANFVNNDPCPRCRALHGQRVGMEETFRDTDTRGIYMDLQGPPRHPRCKCFILVVTRSLANAFQKLDIDAPEKKERKSMTAEDLRDLPETMANLIIEGLNAISNWVPITQHVISAVT